MVTQRYALRYPTSCCSSVPFYTRDGVVCLRTPRWLLWLAGLGLYALANGLKVNRAALARALHYLPFDCHPPLASDTLPPSSPVPSCCPSIGPVVVAASRPHPTPRPGQVAAFNMGSMTVLASVFSTLLVFNLVLSVSLLGEVMP